MLIRLLLAAVAATALALLPARSGAANPTLTASVGPGFTISLKDASGQNVSHLDPGTYTINVSDQSDEHNFHLFGPGVDESTPVETTQTTTWTVTFTDGTYQFRCDAHPNILKGSFTVGTVSTPPPPPPPTGGGGLAKGTTLRGTVATSSIKLVDAGSKLVKKVKSGRKYKLVISDKSSKNDFHLTGPGVNKKTSVRKTGKVTWKLKFKKGKTYKYRSDAHSSMRGSFKAV
jgi:plastocyanin